MAQAALPLDLAQEAVDALNAAGGVKAHAAKALDLPHQTYANRLKAAAKYGLLLDHAPAMPGFQIKSVASKEGDKWVKQTQEPGEEFEVPANHVVKGVSALVDPDGRVVQQWIKTREGNSPVLADAIKSAFEAYPGAAVLPAPKGRTSDDMLVIYPIVDLHLGMFAWAKETGTDYDMKIAADALIDSVSDLVARSAPATEALVLDMGDYFHADNSRNQTARSGNSLDVDTRYAKVVQIGVELTVRVIELALQKHKQVRYRKLPGNHDDETSLMLAVAIAAHFRNNPRVIVDTTPSRFFMHQHGKCLVAATHGDMLKMGDLAGFTAAQWPAEWGATTFRYGYTGHIHNEKALAVNTLRGMRAESFNTLAAKDAWHAGMGYQAPRNMVSITLHKEKGETDRLTVAA